MSIYEEIGRAAGAALRAGDADLLASLFALGANTARMEDEERDRKKKDRILAVEEGRNKCDCLTVVVDKKDDINVKDGNGNSALHIAANQGHTVCVETLVAFEAKVNERNLNGETAVCVAAVKGYPECVKALLEAKASFSIKEKNDKRCLCLSAGNGHVECVNALMFNLCTEIEDHDIVEDFKFVNKGLLRQRESLDDGESQMSATGCAALFYASILGEKECLDALIDFGLDVNKANLENETPIFGAAMHGNFECLTALIKAGADVTVESNEDGQTALFPAASNGYNNCLTALIKAGANVNIKDNTNQTALSLAVSQNNLECVNTLIQSGANVNLTTLNGMTCLFLAAFNGCAECVNLLIEAGADIHAKDENGRSALFCTALKGKDNCLDLLIKAGVKVNEMDNTGKTPLALAAKENHESCMEKLIQAGANIFARDVCHEIALDKKHRDKFSHISEEVMINEGNFPVIVIAAWKGDSERVKSLIEIGVDVNAKGMDETTALIAASWEGNVKCVDLLLAVDGVDINARDYRGRTALTAAACDGHVNCMKPILDKLQSLNETDAAFAFVGALSNKHVECVKLVFNYLPESITTGSDLEYLILRCLEEAADKVEEGEDSGIFLTVLKAGIFRWKWYPACDGNHIRGYTRELIINGLAPDQFTFVDKQCTPLQYAFKLCDSNLVRYLLANLYITPYDLSHFKSDKDLSDHVHENGSEEIQELYKKLVSAPWRLELFSNLEVSNMLRKQGFKEGEGVSLELKKLLPERFLRRLTSLNPIRRLCVTQWDKIEGDILNFKNPVFPGEDDIVENTGCTTCFSPCFNLKNTETSQLS